MGFMTVDPHITGLVWLCLLILACVFMAYREDPVVHKCRGCHGCKQPCGKEER